jgi:cytochrome oxidase Cu insertion factor (SCO1/SenC/PrrC family)
MGTRSLMFGPSLVLGVLPVIVTATAQPHPFVAMNALRVTPPASAPDVAFQALDGRQARLATLRGLPVLLTFFTTW